MSDTTTTAPATTTTATTTTTTVPTTPTTATTKQVAAHHSILQNAIAEVEKLPQTVENAEKYLDLQAQSLATWVSAKHVKTRLLEVGALFTAIGVVIGWLISHL
jgi:hypothetical protein